jgi:5-methylcytosine-specific restriction enzyme subunit McrC
MGSGTKLERAVTGCDSMIPVKNVYYMLSYVFQTLNESGYKKMATESFHNALDLCAAILEISIALQIKRGLGKDYVAKTEPLYSLRGRMDLTESVKTQTLLKKQMVCTYDDYTVNTKCNQIIKTTVAYLLRADIPKTRKKNLRKQMLYFRDVDLLEPKRINWRLFYHRNNQTYRFIIFICHLALKSLLQDPSKASHKQWHFFDDRDMHVLFEKFVRAYFKKEFPQLKVNAPHIKWKLDDGFEDMLPRMKTDIMLTHKKKILIIDTKYYAEIARSHYGAETLRSAHLYQLFTYVKNQAEASYDRSMEVAGMLLYAQPEGHASFADKTSLMSGNKISVRSLDLNSEWKEIAHVLNQIVKDSFEIEKLQ